MALDIWRAPAHQIFSAEFAPHLFAKGWIVGNIFAKETNCILTPEQPRVMTVSPLRSASNIDGPLGSFPALGAFALDADRALHRNRSLDGQRIRESTATRSKTLALKIEDKRRRALEEGAAGIKKRNPPQLLSVASDAWIASKEGKISARSVAIEKANLKHILPELGRKLVTDLEPKDISRYQKKRLEEGASPKTVNLEVGTIRAMLKRHGQWARLQAEVKCCQSTMTSAERLQPMRNALCLRLAANRGRVLCCRL